MQRVLLASQLAHPDHPSQNTALLSHLQGEIDADRLAAAFATVVAANDVLRTRIGGPGAESVDAVDLFSADTIPATEIVEADRGEFEGAARARATRSLDLSACCWDSVIARHPDGTASWYLNLHHVITDATSSAMVFQATAAVYHGLEPAPSASYYEWTSRLTRSLEQPDAAAAKAATHWRTREPAPRIGRLYRAPDRPDPSAHRLPLDLGDLVGRAEARLDDDLRMLTEHLGWSTLLVTATSLWCHRVTGADRFAIGLPVHNRNDAESRDLIGPVMEVFPVDIEVNPDDTARTLHKRVGRSIMQTLARAVPGTAPAADHEIVVNVIPRADQSSFGPIPATTAWLHPGAIDGSHLARVQMTAYAEDQAGAPTAAAWDFALDLNDGAAEVGHRLRAPAHLVSALAAIVDEPDTPLADWGLPTDEEQAALERWGHGPDFESPTTPVVAALRQALADNADVVVEDDDRSLTGPELLAWIDATAGWLHEQGVGPASRVGIDLPRSVEAVVAIIATLETGGSFVPLDPAQPAARRQRLAERAGCRLVIGSTETITATRPDTVPTPITPTAPSGSPGPEDDQERDEAYVIFTSGSTGEPKGVPITRLGLARYLRFATERYSGDGRPPVVAPLFSPLTFDLTITTLFLPLLTGGRLVVVPE
ncbi:MAG: AMP-binding protein, partial [Actinomycetota bacterium]